MRFFERFFSKLGYSKKAPSSLYANPIVTSGYTLGAGGHENYAKYLEQYADATWVFACVRRIATKAAGVPFVVMKKVRKNGKIGYETVQEHPVLDLLDKVNPHMTGADLRETTLSHLELTGNSYWFLDKFMRGKPTEIYPLCPSQVEIIPDKIDRIKAYNYKISEDKTISIPPEQIIHFKYFNSQDEYYGLSALSAGRLAVETQNLGDNYNKKFFENSAEPRGMLTSDNALTHEQRKQITHMWRTMHQGTANAHKSGLVDGGLKWMPIGLSQKDMEFIQSKKMTREDILGVFGVPPVMVGIFEYANYANSQEQREIFWKDTMVP
jgi:HK97 family phage portal protein